MSRTPVPRPTPTSVTVTVKRCIWTDAPRGSYEVSESLTCDADPEFKAAENLDAVHALVKRVVDAHMTSDTAA